MDNSQGSVLLYCQGVDNIVEVWKKVNLDKDFYNTHLVSSFGRVSKAVNRHFNTTRQTLNDHPVAGSTLQVNGSGNSSYSKEY